MNEAAAKDIVLVRAIETADRQQEILSQDDRLHANRSARELTQWRASETGDKPSVDYFLHQRATLILQRLTTRVPLLTTAFKHQKHLRKLSVLLPCLAFLLGVGLDRITDPHRVDLLSLPLLSIVAWNLPAYIIVLFWACVPDRGTRLMRSPLVAQLASRPLTLPHRLLHKLPPKLSHSLTAGLSAFTVDWMRLAQPLMASRLARTLHMSAAMFAIGAVASLYLRGMFSAYSAGWESTFLTPQQLHHLLSTIFAPARLLFQMKDFSLTDLQALQFVPGTAWPQPEAILTGAGARWVHLYAATILLLVILPRLALAALMHWRAARLQRRFPLPLEEAYFRQLTGALSGKPGILRVLPYSFTVDERRDRGLVMIAARLLGEHSRIILRPSSAYGQALEPAPIPPVSSDKPRVGDAEADVTVDLTAVLFNLAATPETQTHGEFLQQVLSQVASAPAKRSARSTASGTFDVVVLIDESSYLARLGNGADSAQRLKQRIALWQQFCTLHGASAMIVNLLDLTP